MKSATQFCQWLSVRLLVFGIIAISFASCKRDDDPQPDDDFSQEIKSNIPAATMEKLREMGLKVNEGVKPPQLAGTYWMSPRVMTKTWVPMDDYEIGDYFADMKFMFYNQDSKKLTISLDYKEYNRYDGSLLTDAVGKDGAFISGSGKYFTVFVITEGIHANKTTRYRTLEVFSGEMAAGGIKNLQTGLVMLDNYGNVNSDLIPNDTGRTFEDEDGFTETTSSFRSSMRVAGGEGSSASGGQLRKK